MLGRLTLKAKIFDKIQILVLFSSYFSRYPNIQSEGLKWHHLASVTILRSIQILCDTQKGLH